jgi:iron complex outermembrane recepter protein
MKTAAVLRHRPAFRWCQRVATLLVACLDVTNSQAQSSDSTGVITGRVYHIDKNEYVRDAQIRVVGGSQTAVSQDDGTYRIVRVPAGTMTLTVHYTGLPLVTASVSVTPGQVTRQDFEVSASRISADASAIKLDAFVVTDERAGNAKAIMRQRDSMNIITALASDTFGDIPDGNVATFIKDLPGVDIETAGGVVDRMPRLRGLPGDYAQVTIDGLEPASADANSFTAGNARSFIFEQVSLNSMGSVEIHKTVSADQEANAPAGTIELKSKRAFERKGRRIALLAGLSAHSSEFYFDRRTYGPDDSERKHRILPNAILEFSDVYLGGRLGLVANLSYADVFVPSETVTNTYNFTPTAADPRPVVPTAIAVGRSQRANETYSLTFTTDYKATDNLVFTFVGIYNYKDNEVRPYNATFNAGGRATILGDDPLLSFTTSTAGGTARSVSISNTTTSKFSESFTYAPRFEYKRGDLQIDGRMMYSTSRSQYEEQLQGKMRAVTLNTLTGVNFSAQRSSSLDSDWKIQQLSGADWADLSNYTNPRIGDEERKATKDVFSANLNASLTQHWAVPVTWKIGAMSKRTDQEYRNETAYLNHRYDGPGGGPNGNFGAFPSNFVPDFSLTGAQVTSTSGRSLTFANHQTIRTLFLERPDFFTPIGTADNYYTAFIENQNKYKEDIDAAFVMGTASMRNLKLRAGLRWEDTTTRSTEFDPLPESAVTAAGFVVGANARATTIPGLQHQYFSRPKINRTGGYDYFFPSASAKYEITSNLIAHAGYSRTIRRPSFSDVTGVFEIDEDTLTVIAPNPNLEPEISDNYSARLAYYFEPIGILGIDLYEYRITGSRMTTELTAAEFGLANDPVLANYRFITGISSPSEEWLRGMDIEYRQSLSFLPKPFSGLNVRFSYGRNYASSVRTLLAPHMVKAGLSYNYRRHNFSISYRWTDDTPENTTLTRYRRHESIVDAGGTYGFSDRYSAFFSVKNLFDSPLIGMEEVGGSPALGRTYTRGRTYWLFGIKAVF